MGIHLTWLWSDLLVYILLILIIIYFCYAKTKPHLISPWRQVMKRRSGIVSCVFLLFFSLVAFLDSIHFMPAENGKVTQMQSVLDVVIAPMHTEIEKTYSAPFAKTSYTKYEETDTSGEMRFDYLRLNRFVKHHNELSYSLMITVAIALVVSFLFYFFFYRRHPNRYLAFYTGLGLIWFTAFLSGFSHVYHVLGTNQVGQDILYINFKSIRTGLLIGTLTSLFMLPFALCLGTFAGYFGGKVDDLIQYVYTTLSSIPGVLLIAASILSLQIYMTNHAHLFETLESRADLRLLALCFILGVTNWVGLCRLLRGETMKLKTMDYVSSAKALGVSNKKIIFRHIFPNIMHIVLIVVVLDFSGLVLAEAVLSYVGVGVDPTTFSWGNMINAARLEMAREPIVWWPLLSAFIFMFLLVVSANIFADVVRDAFDPKLRK